MLRLLIQKVTTLRGKAADEFLQLNLKYIENKEKLKEAKKAKDFVEENKKLVEKGEEPKELPNELKEKTYIAFTNELKPLGAKAR